MSTKRIRLTDIAEATGLSISTVSRYMNAKSIRPISAMLIRDYLNSVSISETASLVHPSPDSRQICLGVLIPEISELFYAQTLQGIFDAAANLDYHIILETAQRSAEREKQALKRFAACSLQGLIIAPLAMKRGEPIAELQAFNHLPLVVLNRRNLLPGRPHVYTDNIKGGYIATKYLLSCGRRKIGIVLGTWGKDDTFFNSHVLYDLARDGDSLGGFTSMDRFRGYLMALQEQKIPYDPSLVSIVTWDNYGGIRGTADLLAKNRDIDGIIYTSDTMAVEGIGELRSRGMSVPDDISVLGWSRGLLTRFTNPKLSSVDQRYYEAGYSSVLTMSRLLSGVEVHDTVFDPTVVPMETTAMKKPAASQR